MVSQKQVMIVFSQLSYKKVLVLVLTSCKKFLYCISRLLCFLVGRLVYW